MKLKNLLSKRAWAGANVSVTLGPGRVITGTILEVGIGFLCFYLVRSGWVFQDVESEPVKWLTAALLLLMGCASARRLHQAIVLLAKLMEQRAAARGPLYEGTKRVYAWPMTRGEYNTYQGWQCPANENPEDIGYLVEYLDGGKSRHAGHAGYISWSPKDVFERSYRRI
jgi:hypothetical protein